LQNIFSPGLASKQRLATRLLSAAWLTGRLAAAYLLTGRALPEKWQIAKELAGHLNCSRTTKQVSCSCLKDNCLSEKDFCINCRWISKQSHPQAFQILSGDGSASGKISVEKTRELCAELNKTCQYFRVIVVEAAGYDIFHRPAANTLLKTIEESKPKVVFLLFALSASEVLPTVVSRCQQMEIVATLSNAFLRIDGNWSASGQIDQSGMIDESELLELDLLIEEAQSGDDKKCLAKSLALQDKLKELIEERELHFDQVVDAMMSLELKRISRSLKSSGSRIAYAQGLLSLFELAKAQNKQFVSKKVVIESLVFAWSQLHSSS